MKNNDTSPSGCWGGCLYIILSYPINWVVLKYIWPAVCKMPVPHRELPPLFALSPITLPIELCMMGIDRFAAFFDWLTRIIF